MCPEFTRLTGAAEVLFEDGKAARSSNNKAKKQQRKMIVWVNGNVSETFLFSSYLSKEEFSSACFIRQAPYRKIIRTGSFRIDGQAIK